MKTTLITSFIIALIMTTLIQPVTAQATADDRLIENIVQTMENGWNTKSGKAFATHFADRHDYIVWNGFYLANCSRDSNAMAHQEIFDSIYEKTDLKLIVDKIRYLREDMAIAHLLGATYEQGNPIPENPKVIITIVVEKNGDNWQIISFHNCNIELSFDPEHPRYDPFHRVMFRNWYEAVR